MKALADHQCFPQWVPFQLPPLAFADLSYAKPAEKPMGQQQTSVEPIAFTRYCGNSWAQAVKPFPSIINNLKDAMLVSYMRCLLYFVCVVFVFVLEHQTFLSIAASFTLPKFSCCTLKYPLFLVALANPSCNTMALYRLAGLPLKGRERLP